MKLVLVCICVATVLGVLHAAPYEYEQFHDSYEEQPELQIGETANHSEYGKKVNVHKPIQGGGVGAAKAENTLAVQRDSPAIVREVGSSSQSSSVARKTNYALMKRLHPKSGKEYRKQQDDHFDQAGHESDKLHGEYDHA